MIKEETKEELNLDFGWLEEILISRASRYSSVACVATSDPKRVVQIKAFLCYCGDFAESSLYCFNPWRGLEKLNRNDSQHLYFEAVKPPVGEYAQMAGIQNDTIDINWTLHYMGDLLGQRRTVFIIEYVDDPGEATKDRYLIYALRSWSHDSEIMRAGSLIIVVAGSFSRVLDELTREYAILSRPSLPANKERQKIISDIFGELKLKVAKNEDDLVRATSGLNLHQLESTLLEAYQRHGNISVTDVKNMKNDFIKSSEVLEMLEPVQGGFNGIGGYQSIKDFVNNKIIRVLNKTGDAAQLSLTLPRGFVLFGPPGTGKSLFARCLAGEVDLPVVNFRTERLISKWLGESGQRFEEAIRMVEQMSPLILFIDEIDKLLMRRSGEINDGASSEMRRVTNQVLEWLGDKKRQSIIVGATNRPEDLDKAAIRPGRIDYMIPMLYPDTEGRKHIIKVHLGLEPGLNEVPLALDEAERESVLQKLALETEGCTGAELEDLVNRAKYNAFIENSPSLTAEHFSTALKSFRVDDVDRQMQRKYYLRMAKEYCSSSEFMSEINERI